MTSGCVGLFIPHRHPSRFDCNPIRAVVSSSRHRRQDRVHPDHRHKAMHTRGKIGKSHPDYLRGSAYRLRHTPALPSRHRARVGGVGVRRAPPRWLAFLLIKSGLDHRLPRFIVDCFTDKPTVAIVVLEFCTPHPLARLK